jgi:hypothetical protein
MIKKIQNYLSHIFFLALVVWGIYATIVFLGIDSHIVVLLKDDAWKAIARDFKNNGEAFPPIAFWRGLNALVPMVQYFIERAGPFLVYGVISVLAYLIYVAYIVLGKGQLFIEKKVNALQMMLLFFGSLWLLFTTLFYVDLPYLLPSLILEPSRESLKESVSDEALIVLEENFDRLKESNCIERDIEGRANNTGAKAYWYKGACVQKAFFTRVMSQALMLMFLILNFLVIGKFFLKLLKFKTSKLLEFTMSLGLGAAGVTLIIWTLALLEILNAMSAWITFMVILMAGYPYVSYWIKSVLNSNWKYKTSFFSVKNLIIWLLITYLAFNFLTVIRPFPIGWDDLGKYINGPRQVSVFGHIIPGMLAIQWEYLTSLGFVLFGYFSTFGATLAQQINWMAGLFATFAVFVCARSVLGEGRGSLAALFYYTLPMVGHFSFADMKTENALLFYGALGITAVVIWIKNKEKENPDGNGMKWLFIAGVLFAAGVATKPTIVLLFLMAGTMMTFDVLGVSSGIGSILLGTLILTKSGAIHLSKVATKLGVVDTSLFNIFVTGSLLIVGVLLFVLPFVYSRKRSSTKTKLTNQKTYWVSVMVISAGFIAFSSPWMINNIVANGGFVNLSSMIGAPNVITPSVAYNEGLLPVNSPEGSRFLPPELELDTDHERCVGTSEKEELDRYWGYGEGRDHFLGLPWRVIMNKDSQGYYLTTSPLLLLVPLLLLLPMFWKKRILRFIFWGTFAYIVQWVFAASGIPWYGIGMFLGLSICIEAVLCLSTDRASKIVGGVLCTLAIIMVLSLRLWQFSMQINLHEYSWGKASHEVLREMTIPDYGEITKHVIELSKNEETPYLYRMGTFISYFIPRNREFITLNDNQLGFFNCINQEEDHKLTLKRLRALGFHSIVFDTNTATIEKDQNGTLHQKVSRFMEFANNSELGITSIVNNPGGGIAYMILPEEIPEDVEAEDSE